MNFEQHSDNTFRIIRGTATELNHQDRYIAVSLKDGSTEKLEYHALVIAAGASTVSPPLGLNRDSGSLRGACNAFRKALPSAKQIFVAGRGPVDLETPAPTGESQSPITLVTVGPQILPALRPAIADKVERFLVLLGGTVIKGAPFITVSPPGAGTGGDLTTNATVTLQDGKTFGAGLFMTLRLIPALSTDPC
ncbi:hypothetical protein PITC_032810 [Penicillium italicum]|uniref:FAD/NAD(P)-binding domain-containing protein n=1 Tax=Penicillium italicum TaxID=40296 RepID=A0A0A2LGX9_PENIT|nr:hypothetical protein PITC_032810 [Penicillium italicum]